MLFAFANMGVSISLSPKAEIIGTFIDNIEDFNIKMWISLDKDIFICVSPNNADNIIRYLYERYPY